MIKGPDNLVEIGVPIWFKNNPNTKNPAGAGFWCLGRPEGVYLQLNLLFYNQISDLLINYTPIYTPKLPCFRMI